MDLPRTLVRVFDWRVLPCGDLRFDFRVTVSQGRVEGLTLLSVHVLGDDTVDEGAEQLGVQRAQELFFARALAAGRDEPVAEALRV